MELKSFFAQDLQGNVIPSPTVHIYTVGTETAISGLQDADGDALTNPFTGTAEGQIVVAAPSGTYDMRVTGGGRDTTQRVKFIDLDEQITEAEGLVTAATNQANAAAASAASAATITGLSTVKSFTNPLASAPRVFQAKAVRPPTKVLHNAAFDITGDFTLHRRVFLESSEAAGGFIFASKSASGNANFQFDMGTVSQRLPRMIVPGTPAVAVTATDYLPLSAFGRVTDLTVRGQVSGSDVLVSFFVDGVKLGATVTAVGADMTVANTAALYVGGYSAESINTETALNTLLFNRAMTDAEILSLSVNGVSESDLHGSQSNLATAPSDLTDGAWTKFQCTIDDDAVTGPDGVTPADVIVPDSGVVQGDIRYNIAAPVAGHTYRTECDAKAAGYDKIVVGGFLYGAGAGGGVFDLTLGTVTTATAGLTCRITPLADDWHHLVVEGLEFASGPQFQYIGAVFSGTADGVSGVAVDNVKITELGCTLDLNAEDAQSDTGQIFDRANKNHALLPASAAKVIPKRMTGSVRGTNTWAASSSTQYVVGTNQHHLPASAAFTVMDIIASGSVTVHIGDGTDVDRFGASIALSAGRNRVTLATPFVDGTNLKLTLTPTGSFTGTLETTAQFIVLED